MRISDWSSDVCSSDLVFDAEQALAIGLLHECVAAEALDDAVERALHWLQKGGPVAQAQAKRLALAMAGMDANTQQRIDGENRSEEHTSELQSLMRISYAVFCLKKKKKTIVKHHKHRLSTTSCNDNT